MRIVLIIASISILFVAHAQEHPAEHMSELAANYDQINKDTWGYIRQVSRGKNANRIEKRRRDLVETLRKAKYEASRVKPYKGDNSLKQAYVNYLNLSYHVINDNYKKIVDLERIAEESYDAMEAYLLTKERVNLKMDSAQEELNRAQATFASKYNIQLTSEDSRISRKLNNAGQINSYYNRVYLLFYKSAFYEGKMLEAAATGNVGDIEQYRQTLEIASEEGMEAIKKIGGYHGDHSLKNACYEMVEFYFGEAVRYMPKQIDFFTKKDRMETLVKNFESKKNPTQQEIDEYNQSINDYNNAIGSFNETGEYLNKYRTKRLENLNKTIDAFYNKHL